MIGWMLMAAQEAGLVARAREVLAVERRCPVAETTDVTVCGLRNADRYRVPLVEHDPGDPAHEGVPAERERLLHRTTPIQDLGPFLVGGGAFGVHATVSGRGSRVEGLRPLAP